MMKLFGTSDLIGLLRDIGLERFLELLRERLQQDFADWQQFDLSPRHATQFDQGVIELMPCAGHGFYTFKFVNGHPHNVAHGLPTVVAFGVLAETTHGLPLLITEMTLLTALRTAATAALGVDYLARDDARVLALLGCGAQAEFQALAIAARRPISEIRYLDIDAAAMTKFSRNLDDGRFALVPCRSVAALLNGCDILVTATAARRRARLFDAAMVPRGLHIHALGGDCPGKTELDPALLTRARIVVEYLPQSRVEGEIQQLADTAAVTELWQLVRGDRPGRARRDEITLFDSVGFALEDYSTLRLVHELAEARGLGQQTDLIVRPEDPKDLYRLVSS